MQNKKQIINLVSRFLILLILCVVMSFLRPDAFLTANNLRQVLLEQAPFTILISFGMSLCIISHGIDISLSSTMVLSAYLSANAFLNGKYFLGALIAIAVGGGFGALNGILISKIRYRHLSQLIVSILSLWDWHMLSAMESISMVFRILSEHL